MLPFELILIMILAILIIMGQVWLNARWENRVAFIKVIFFLIPWLPFFFLIGLEKIIIIDILDYRINLSILGLFAIALTIVNSYRILWAILIDIQSKSYRQSSGLLLLKISTAISFTISVIVFLFGLAYSVTTYLSGISGENFIMEASPGNRAVAFDDYFSFFYFSAVTYFSLGYGDYFPRGSIMLFLVFVESVIGYVNSGILIAYAFNIFRDIAGNRRTR